MAKKLDILSSVDMKSLIKSGLERSHGLRRAKIVCTIGPASDSVEQIKKLLHAGMNVARLNFSHGEHETHLRSIQNIRQASAETGIMCAILLDNKGPEIRSGKLKNGGKPVNVTKGQTLTILCSEDVKTFEGDNTTIACDYKRLPHVIDVGKTIKIGDGLLVTTVLSKDESEGKIVVRVENTCELGQRKGMNLPGTNVDLPSLMDRDEKDLIFGATNKVDFVAASFTRSAGDVKEIRRVLSTVPGGEKIMVISKIENQQGLDNLDSILEAADGIMVARGDLGVEIPIQKVSAAQKMIIRKCNIAGKPVITATQMLESMVENPRPTRAEVTDVANAVLDGTDCVMLSGETAKGNYPVEAASTMAKICVSAEIAVDHVTFFDNLVRVTPRPMQKPEAIAGSAVRASIDVDAAAIIVITRSGSSARRVSKYNPAVPIITLTPDDRVARQCLAIRGLQPFLVIPEHEDDGDAAREKNSSALFQKAVDLGKEKGWVKAGDDVILVKGRAGIAGTTDTLQVISV